MPIEFQGYFPAWLCKKVVYALNWSWRRQQQAEVKRNSVNVASRSDASWPWWIMLFLMWLSLVIINNIYIYINYIYAHISYIYSIYIYIKVINIIYIYIYYISYANLWYAMIIYYVIMLPFLISTWYIDIDHLIVARWCPSSSVSRHLVHTASSKVTVTGLVVYCEADGWEVPKKCGKHPCWIYAFHLWWSFSIYKLHGFW